MTFKSRIGDNFSNAEKSKFKSNTFSLIPSESELTGKSDKLKKFVNKYMTSIAKRLYADGKIPLDEEEFIKIVTNVESKHFICEMAWIYQFITKKRTRKWNAIPIGFHIYELGLDTSLDKSEPMDYKELLKKFTYGMTTVGPSFTMEEKRNYLESTGKKLNYLCPIFMLGLIDALIDEVPRNELKSFIEIVEIKAMNFLNPKNKKFQNKEKKDVGKKKWTNKFNKEKAEAEAKKAKAEQVEHIVQTESPEVPKIEQPAVELDANGNEVHYAPTEAELTAEKEAIEAAKAADTSESPNK